MIKSTDLALVGWLCWLERCPVYQKSVGSVPGQGTYLGCRFNPWSQRVRETTSCFSLTSMFLPPFRSPRPISPSSSLGLLTPSKSIINKHILR